MPDKEPLYVEIDRELKRALEAVALQERRQGGNLRTLSDVVRRACEEFIARRGPDKQG